MTSLDDYEVKVEEAKIFENCHYDRTPQEILNEHWDSEYKERFNTTIPWRFEQAFAILESDGDHSVMEIKGKITKTGIEIQQHLYKDKINAIGNVLKENIKEFDYNQWQEFKQKKAIGPLVEPRRISIDVPKWTSGIIHRYSINAGLHQYSFICVAISFGIFHFREFLTTPIINDAEFIMEEYDNQIKTRIEKMGVNYQVTL